MTCRGRTSRRSAAELARRRRAVAGGHGARRGRAVRDGRRRRTGSPTTTSARARASTRRLLDRRAAGDERRSCVEFIEDGGYERRELWSERGLGVEAAARRSTLPRYWQRDGDGFAVRCSATSSRSTRASRSATSPGTRPTPTRATRASACRREAEWEKAASWDPAGGDEARYPWGDERRRRASARTSTSSPSARPPPGAYPDGRERLRRAADDRRRLGVDRRAASSAYAGFEAFPYPEYSEAFFGGPFRVLRGGSWATQPERRHDAFRNWDYPERRQIFAGFRCARDAE